MVALNNSSVQYVDSTAWGNIAAWISNHTYAAGVLITNTANTPALGNERVFVSIVAGTSTNGSLPTLTATKGAKTVDNGVTWQECTGQPGVNGDITNSPVWGASLTVVLGQITYDSVSGALQICTTAGTAKSGSPPSFSATAGVTTSDNTVTWTSLGAASNFAAFAAPHKRILNADAATWQTVVPATIYIGDDHAETQSSSLVLAGGQGGSATPNNYICVSHTTAPPTTVTTGATVTTTSTSAITFTGFGYYYGISFNAGSGSASQTNLSFSSAATFGIIYTENCSFQLSTTGTTASFVFGNGGSIGTGSSIHFNPTFVFQNTSQTFKPAQGSHQIVNATIAATGAAPSILVSAASASTANFLLRDTDLSNITGTLYTPNSQSLSGSVLFENCKLAVGVAMTSGTFPHADCATFRLHACDSGTKVYRFYETGYLGTIQQETTIVDNTNPASDGTTTISWNIATTANTSFGNPYVSPEIAQWNALTSGSHTATIQINSNVALTDANCWMELEYMGSSATPIATSVLSRASNIVSTPTTIPTSTDSWGGALSHQQKMSVTFSPAAVGYVKARIYVADPSITVYVNPLIQIS